MNYKVLGLMSGSSLNGLDIAYIDFVETAGKWTYEILASECSPYSKEWLENLKGAVNLTAREYQLLDSDYGAYIAEKINAFIEKHSLHHKVHLASVHGHTTFHMPERGMTAQLGDGATIAAHTGLPVVNGLRSMDVALGGQGAPIVPIGEKLLFPDYDLFLNLGGIANISYRKNGEYIAFDVCPANRVLNMLANQAGKEYDENGAMASEGIVSRDLLASLNRLDYYQKPWPKSLANEFGTRTVFPLVESSGLSLSDRLRTYITHIAEQVRSSAAKLLGSNELASNKLASELGTGATNRENAQPCRLLVTGGGASNGLLISSLRNLLREEGIELVVPDAGLINYKEALIMGLIGVLRWREESTVMASVTGARRDSVGGALWMGMET